MEKSMTNAIEETNCSRTSPNAGNGAAQSTHEAEKAASSPPQMTYPGPMLATFLYIALLLAMFLVALDISIIATAIPTITAQFGSTDQVGWYGSAFFMTLAAFQAFWGKAYKYFPLKVVFLICIGVFELGSLVIATARNSTAIIVGRALQGAGGAGITGGCYTICAFITRPQYISSVFGIFSLVWSCSSVLGPVLGGIFTQDATWRWCFYINLPIGGITMALVLLLFKTPPQSRLASCKWNEAFFLFDIPGVALVVGAFACLLTALEDAGQTRPWHSGVVIGLLIGFGVITIIFVVWEWRMGEKAMVVPRILKRRSIIVVSVFAFFAQGAGFARSYNLPIYFQAAQGVSPSESGIRNLPTVLTTSIFALIGSIAVGRVGWYLPFFLVGGVLLTVGSGMIYTLDVGSSAGEYIGYQVLASIGSGLVIQLPTVVAQAITPRVDMSVAVAITLFFQFCGGTIGVSATQNIQNNVLLKAIKWRRPSLDPSVVLAAGSAYLTRSFPNPADSDAVAASYMEGLKAEWIWGIVLCGLATLVACFGEWRSIRPEAVKQRLEQKKARETATTVSA